MTVDIKAWILFFAAGSGFFSSCSPQYTYFTESLYQQKKWSEEDIRRIQFYVSEDIVLTRSMKEGEISIAEGKIKIKNGQRIEQVVVQNGTPGVLVLMPEYDRFGISFENEDDAYLMFGPNPKHYDRFALLAQDWDQEHGNVHYKGNIYSVDASSAFACLMVDLDKEGENQLVTRNVSGRIIKE